MSNFLGVVPPRYPGAAQKVPRKWRKRLFCWGFPLAVDRYEQCQDCAFPNPAVVVIWKSSGAGYHVCQPHFRWWVDWAQTYGQGGLIVNPLIAVNDLRPYLPPGIESDDDLYRILEASDGKRKHRLLH